MRIRLNEVPLGTRVFLREPMESGEVRETHYSRRPNAPTRYPRNVSIARTRVVQGVPGGRPRYDSGSVYITDPGEADGLTTVLMDELPYFGRPSPAPEPKNEG